MTGIMFEFSKFPKPLYEFVAGLSIVVRRPTHFFRSLYYLLSWLQKATIWFVSNISGKIFITYPLFCVSFISH